MKKNIWQLIFSFILIALIGYISWVGVSFFFKRLLAADPTISASIVGAMTTVFIGLAVVVINNRQIRLRDITEAHRTKKVEIYEAFLKTIITLTVGQNNKVSLQPPTEQELIDSLVNYKREILLWGSPEVIKCQLEFENVTNSKETAAIFLVVDKLYKAIRHDIGLSNSGLNNHELVKFFITDRDDFDKLIKSHKEN